MKKQLLYSWLLAMLFCITGASNAWGDTKELTFDVDSNPGGWPTTNSTTLTNYTYTLSGVNYTFALKNVKCNSGYLMMTYVAALGLPAIEGYKLTKVVATNSGSCSTSTRAGISSSSSDASYITGGSYQTWSITNSKYTYNLSSTEENTMYYLYITNKNAQVTRLTLTYESTVTNYAITKSATNGTISTQVSSAEVTEAAENATVTITATPNTGYSFSSWSVTKTSGGASVSVANASASPTTFTMPAEAVTVAATFTKNSHDLDLTSTNGTCAVTIDGKDWDGSSAIEYGAAVEITATPSSGYLFNAWDHTLTSPTISSNVISFSMPDEDVAIEAQFVEAASVKSITISDAIEHGTVTANVNTASAGDIIELTATPDAGYQFSSWTVKNASTNADITVEENMFEMPDADVTVSATFTEVVAASVSLDITETTIYLGATTATLTPTVLPATTLNKAVTWESSDPAVATVSNGVVTPVALGTATITVKTANNQTATCAVTVATAPKGSQYDPFTCAEAIAAYENAGAQVDGKYVKGIVTKISGSTYWLSDDGVVDNEQFECYNGKQDDGTTAINSTYLNVGDVVVASGNILLYNSTTYELASGNVVYSKTRPAVTITRNNDSYGTATLTTRTVTATPADGYRVIAGEGGYTVTTGSATVTNNGDNTLTLSGIWADCTVQVNFEALPTHTATFYCNGSTVSSTSVAEGSAITFPAAVATPSADQIPETYNGKTFIGWFTDEYTHATDAPAYVNSANMGNADVTYYAVYANVSGSASWTEATLASMTASDIFVIASGTYAMKNDGGTSGSPKPANITVADGKITSTVTDAMKWKVSGNGTDGYTFYPNGSTTTWLYCSTTASSGSNDNLRVGTGDRKLWVYSNSYLVTNDTHTDRYLSMYGTTDFRGYINTASAFEPKFYKYQGPTYTNFTTDARAEAGISFANASVDAQLTSGYTGQTLTNPNSVTVTYSSSEETVATINSSTGAITGLLKAGSTTITATFAGNATYKAAEVSYTLNVTEKTPAGLAYATAEVAKLTTDKAFTNTLTNDHSLTVSYASDDTDVATVDASTGEVTIKGAGTATITATFAGNETYAAGNASYTLTVSKATPTLSFAADNATLREGKDFAGNTLNNPAGLTVTYSSSATGVATVDPSTGVPAFEAAGTTTITATFAGNDTYNAANASYTLTVKAAPTISVSDAEVTCGNTFTVDDSGFTGGAVTVTSGNTDFATVAGLVITTKVVGTVTITVSTAETDTYDAGSATFDLTINAPEGKTTVSDMLIATMDFTDNSGWAIPTDYTTTTSTYTSGDYSITLAGEYKFSSTYTMLKSGSSLTFPTFDKKVTKISVVGNSSASAKTNENIYVGSTAVSTQTTGSTGTNNFEINSSYQAAGTTYVLQVSSANAQITRINVYTEPAATATLNKYGYGTFCSVNPMDFTTTEGYTAWRVSDIATDGTITFQKITETIKGGQGVFLYNKNADGVNKTNVTVNFADGNTEFDADQNKLVGTKADTYVSTVNGIYTNFGLSGNQFVKISGTIPAGKAYLPIPNSIVEDYSAGARLTFIFEDGETTGIGSIKDGKLVIEDGAWYTLGGQKLNTKPTKKGIYVINGKKVVVK